MPMLSKLLGFTLLGSAAALPMLFNESSICATGDCTNGLSSSTTADFKYERVMASQPGYQWDDAGGYW